MTEQWQTGIVKGQKLFRAKKRQSCIEAHDCLHPERNRWKKRTTCLEGQLWVKGDRKSSATFLEKSWELTGIKVKEAVKSYC